MAKQPKRLGYGILSSKNQDGRRLVHPGFLPCAPWQQLLSARLPPYVETEYRVQRMGTFGCYSSMLAGGVCGQRLGLFFCIGSIGACPETVYFLRRSKMADGQFEAFAARSSAGASLRKSPPLD